MKACVLRASILAVLGPQRPFAVARPLSPTLARRGQTNACFLVWVRDLVGRSCCATRPLRMLRIRPDPRGWTPQPPVSKQGLVIKRFLGFCGSRSRRGWLWAAKSKPKRGFGQRHSHPLGGAASSRGGPTERSEKGARCKIRTSSLICTPKPRNKRRFVPCAPARGTADER